MWKNYLKILELQMQGKKKLSVSDFMNGYKFKKLKFR